MSVLLELRRTPERHAGCVLGTLTVLGFDTRLPTLEPPWVPCEKGARGGAAYRSCVPEGTYSLVRHLRPSGEKAWVLVNHELEVYHLPMDAPAARRDIVRTLVYLAAADYVHDIVGGVAVGMGRVKGREGWELERSREAMNVLRTTIGDTHNVKMRIYR
jgi:hypothetical protein